MSKFKSQEEFIAFMRGAMDNDLYLVSRGVRKVALIDVYELDVFFKLFKRISSHPASIPIKYRKANIKSDYDTALYYVVYGAKHKKAAMELKREFEKVGRDHRKIGRLLGYSKEAIDNFVRR